MRQQMELAASALRGQINWQERAVGTVVLLATIASGTALAVNGVREVLENCPPPSAEALQTVTQLFDNPAERPEFTGSNKKQHNQQMNAFLQEKRAELGILMPPYDAKK